MKSKVIIPISLNLLLWACGGESTSNRRQQKAASLDAVLSKPVSFEFYLPDRASSLVETPELKSKINGYYYKLRGEGANCPATEVHEGSGPYEDGHLIKLTIRSVCSYLLTIKLGNFPAPALTATTINYSEHIQPLLKKNCVSCHPSYGDYALAKEASRAIVMAVEGESMPPTAPLVDSDIALFLAWADGNYLESNPAADSITDKEKSLSKVYYRNNNNDYLQSYELLGRTRYELQRSLWLQSDGQAEGLETKQLFTFIGTLTP